MVYFEPVARPDSVGKAASSSRFNRDAIPTAKSEPNQ